MARLSTDSITTQTGLGYYASISGSGTCLFKALYQGGRISKTKLHEKRAVLETTSAHLPLFIARKGASARQMRAASFLSRGISPSSSSKKIILLKASSVIALFYGARPRPFWGINPLSVYCISE